MAPPPAPASPGTLSIGRRRHTAGRRLLGQLKHDPDRRPIRNRIAVTGGRNKPPAQHALHRRIIEITEPARPRNAKFLDVPARTYIHADKDVALLAIRKSRIGIRRLWMRARRIHMSRTFASIFCTGRRHGGTQGQSANRTCTQDELPTKLQHGCLSSWTHPNDSPSVASRQSPFGRIKVPPRAAPGTRPNLRLRRVGAGRAQTGPARRARRCAAARAPGRIS